MQETPPKQGMLFLGGGKILKKTDFFAESLDFKGKS